jgi:tRNA(fMet)-specific endonuclease VapC
MKPRYLLDTSVFSQPLRRRPVPTALARWRDAGDDACRVSTVTLAEVEFGLQLEGGSQRRERFRALLEGRLGVIETDQAVWRDFARRKARQQALGLPVADLDLLIAACAACHMLVVATLNARDFSRIEGIAWEDWSPEAPAF